MSADPDRIHARRHSLVTDGDLRTRAVRIGGRADGNRRCAASGVAAQRLRTLPDGDGTVLKRRARCTGLCAADGDGASTRRAARGCRAAADGNRSRPRCTGGIRAGTAADGHRGARRRAERAIRVLGMGGAAEQSRQHQRDGGLPVPTPACLQDTRTNGLTPCRAGLASAATCLCHHNRQVSDGAVFCLIDQVHFTSPKSALLRSGAIKMRRSAFLVECSAAVCDVPPMSSERVAFAFLKQM